MHAIALELVPTAAPQALPQGLIQGEATAPPAPADVTKGALRQRKYRANNRASHLEKHKKEEREWRARNPEKSNSRARAYRARNPDKVRSANLKKTYGITLDQFNDLLRSQGSKCAICKGSSSTGKNWHVDHCHQGGSIRGILCHSCNLMIGHAADDVDRLLAAVEYLK